jgi:glycosyltransferase involved in cell wall biosynthesis
VTFLILTTLKVSIITVIYNNAQTISDTINSVLSQDYKDIEYIIIDGGSSDGSIEKIKKYNNKIAKFISEPDNGLYDAINKGISLSTGEIVGVLHSDDLYNSNYEISEIVTAFTLHKVDSVYADLVYVNRKQSEKVVRNWISGHFSKKKFQIGWMPPHPTFYVKKEIFKKFGYYDTEFKSAADYELMLRFLYKNNISTYYIPKTMVRMRLGGESNKSLTNRIKANKEDYKAWKKNNLSPSAYLRVLKPLIKLPQFIPIPEFRKVAFNFWI